MLKQSKAATMAVGLSLVWAFAACAPAGPDRTPSLTDLFETPGAVATDPAATMPAATDPTTAMAETAMPTEPAVTAGPTQQAQTPESTAGATVEPSPAPSNEAEPSVLLSTELIGSRVEDANGNSVGTVLEVLVDEAGVLKYVILDAGIYLAGAGPVATADPLASPDPNLLNAGIVAVPLADFEINALPTAAGEVDDDLVLVYQGSAADLEAMAGFDLSVLDQPSFIIDTTLTTLDESFNGLMRASDLSEWILVNPADDNLGEVEDLVLDLREGRLLFGVVDFGGFLGIGEQSTAVPFELFTIEQSTDAEAQLQIDVTAESMETAPVIDVGAWPAWPERVDTNTEWNLNWQNESRQFWEGAAASS